MSRHFFLRDVNNFPVACIASAISTRGQLTDGPLEPDSTIAFAVSIHNPADTFNKARGRDIAKARLLSKKRTSYECAATPNVKKNILTFIAAKTWFPARVREAARFRHEELAVARVTNTATNHVDMDDQPTPEVFTTTGLDHGSAPRGTYEDRFYEPDPPTTDEGDTIADAVEHIGDPVVDGLTGTKLEALMAEHPPEAEVPWTWSNSAKR